MFPHKKIGVAVRNDPFMVFVTEEDHWDLDKYIQQCDLIELSDAERMRVQDAYRYLRHKLGVGFIKRAFRERSPILWLFLNAAPCAKLSVARFAESLQCLESAPNFSRILRRVKRPRDENDLAEGRSLVEVASKFSKAGFSIEFEPALSVTDHRGITGPRYPDLKITNSTTGEEIIVEVSRLRASNKQNLCERTYHVICEVLVHQAMMLDPENMKDISKPRHILPYALIHRGIEDEELKVIVDQLKELIDQVRSSGTFARMIIPDTIEVGIGPYDDHESAKKWAAERGIDDLVIGPDILADEITRARIKLHQKHWRQLGVDMPGIIVIPATENLIFFVYDVRGMIAALAEEVERLPKTLCAIMYHTFDDGTTKDTQCMAVGPHLLTKQVRSDGSVEQSLIISNPSCAQQVTPETSEMIRKAFASR